MAEIENRKSRRKRDKAPTLKEHAGTVIIPQISPEMLEQARRAAAAGKTPEQIEQETMETVRREEEAKEAAQARQAAQAESGVRAAAQRRPRTGKKGMTRAEAQAELVQSVHDDHLWLNNPVMVRGLGLAPAVVAATSGQTALMLCAAAILLLTATRVLAVSVCRRTQNRFRGVIYAYSAAILYIPVYLILYRLFGADLSLLGIYLPLLVVEPAIIKRMEADELETVGEAFRRGINNTVGLCVSLMLVGVLRELLAQGTVFGNKVLSVAPLPLASQPAAGFLLVGLIAAVWTAIGNAYVHYKMEEVRHLYDEPKH